MSCRGILEDDLYFPRIKNVLCLVVTPGFLAVTVRSIMKIETRLDSCSGLQVVCYVD